MNIQEILDKASQGQRISPEQAKFLYHEAPLASLSKAATQRKRSLTGDKVYYNINFHIEPTNVCLYSCKFCSYRKAKGSPEAWDYSLDEIETQAKNQQLSKATEVHIVGGVHPEHNIHHYARMIERVKSALPKVTIKAFSAVELIYMIEKEGMSYTEGLALLKNAGMQTLPGGGAEIFFPEIRKKICPDKADADKWLELHRCAHLLDIPTNATMLYGHIENIDHRIDHLNKLRELQDKTGGFNAFIPLKYRNYGNELSEIGEVSINEDMRMIALSRLFLDNFKHIKAYWPMFGKATTELALAFGADDVDGTIEDTTKIYSMAGAEDQKPSMSISEISKIITNAGFCPKERDSFYNEI